MSQKHSGSKKKLSLNYKNHKKIDFSSWKKQSNVVKTMTKCLMRKLKPQHPNANSLLDRHGKRQPNSIKKYQKTESLDTKVLIKVVKIIKKKMNKA